jgi:hypothetical protein
MTTPWSAVSALSLILFALPPGEGSEETPRRHVEEISAPSWAYRVAQGGTMDGENCRSPLGGGFGIWTQRFESNRSVRLENVGDADVIDPWLSNGRNDFRTVKEIAAGGVRPGLSDGERALAIWRRQTTHRFHAGAADPAEMHDPVKVFNVYGYTTCGDDSVCLAALWHAAGFPVSPGRLLGHRTSEVFYDGRWHLMDGDLGPVYLLRDNTTVASEEDLVRDHDLVKRSHPYGILDPDRRVENELHAALFVSDGKAAADGAIAGIARESTMSMVLRPGEAIVWRWGHSQAPKYHGLEDLSTFGPRKDGRREWGAPASARVCNGLWEYRPDFGHDRWRGGAESTRDVVVERGALVGGSVVWRMKSPYVFVGGRLETAGTGATFWISWDGSTWEKAGVDLDPFFPSRGPARYEYWLKVEVPRGAHLERLAIVNDLQMAPLSLPGMTVGENRFTYTDRSPGARAVRITHEWVECSDAAPPPAPSSALFPPDGGSADRTDVPFRWSPSEGAEDYHFELSDRADVAWPLSSNFEKLVSNTADAGRARYSLPSPGLLTPGRRYYWHVRAGNSRGVWGPWSRTWSFTAGGLAVPVELRLDGAFLRWAPVANAARYRVYGSDEQGFSASDEPRPRIVGRSPEVPSESPANFVAETEETEVKVLGPVAANRAFYRVLAVGASGLRSGPSELVAAPRPFFTRVPGRTARVGEPYEDRVSVTRSLGDLRVRWVDGTEVAAFWDVERPLFALRQGPAWLRIDERSGALAGVPDVPGAVEVVVAVTLERTGPRTAPADAKPWNLGLGKDKAAGIVTERTGEATQRFTVSVPP